MNEQTINSVLSYLRRNPRRSQRLAKRDLIIPFFTKNEIQRARIHMFPWKTTRAQNQRHSNKVVRVTLGEWCKIKTSTDSNFLRRIVFRISVSFTYPELKTLKMLN